MGNKRASMRSKTRRKSKTERPGIGRLVRAKILVLNVELTPPVAPLVRRAQTGSWAPYVFVNFRFVNSNARCDS